MTKTFAMVGLAAGMAIVPAIGSQGAGALGERHVHADSHLISASATSVSLERAARIAEQRVIELTHS